MATFEVNRKRIKRDERGRRTDRVKRREVNQIMRLYRENLLAPDIARKMNRDPRTIVKAIEKEETEVGFKVTTTDLDWRDHYKDLSELLHKMIKSLKAAREIESSQDEMFGDILLNQEQKDGTEYMDDYLSRCLLAHIQAEAPELRDIESWLQLRAIDLSNDLLDKLSMIDLRRKFKGRCSVCKDWD
jgi:hypothetical protein